MNIDEEQLKNEIDKLLKDFYRIKSANEYRLKISSLNVLADAYENLTGEELDLDVPSIDVYLKNFEKVRSYLDEILEEYFCNQKEHNRLTGKIISTYTRSGFKSYNLEKNTSKLSRKKQLELINEFLLDFNPKICDLFNYLLMNNLISDNNTYDDNVTYFYHAKSKPYVMVESLNNVFDIDVLMHEIGHAYSIKMLENKSKTQSLNFTRNYYEMYSTYMELAFQDYLKKNHIKLRDAYILENSFFTYLFHYATLLKSCNECRIFEDFYMDDIEYINQAFAYGYGHYISLRVFDKYLSDKEGINDALNDFLSYQGLLTYDEQLNLFGLNRENLKDMKVLKKKLEMHNSGIKNYIK